MPHQHPNDEHYQLVHQHNTAGILNARWEAFESSLDIQYHLLKVTVALYYLHLWLLCLRVPHTQPHQEWPRLLPKAI